MKAYPYICVQENNEWEGECWWFYVSTDGLEEGEVDRIGAVLKTLYNGDEDTDPFVYLGRVSMIAETEEKLANIEPGYMPPHNFMHNFDLERLEEDMKNKSRDDLNDLLYKGGITKYGDDLYGK